MDKQLILELSKKAILQKFDKNIEIDKIILKQKYPFLSEKRASFVTINKYGKLRGCIGSLIATKSLLDDLVSNSYMAAFEDPRFFELSIEEFKECEIEISILSHPQELNYKDFNDLKDKLIPNIHGVILEFDGRRSTFLPQVWQMLPKFEDFFAQLCFKGSFEIDEKFKPKVYTYEVELIK
ncbi:AmmeMemoRadiSam system protein A [Aliarcobacter thereius]|uniref:AmmeMemoRadiSam system protein A n=1 Tax=Aliarcobacter thereius TaxID=544718 RepID=UPI0010FF39CF|nr:AmmeMemoRadiSam system protein A [Aliarcobacter thereius]TLT08480.1 AmmeMemoRadiSam system protein A [Aliarcobacter thereius]